MEMRRTAPKRIRLTGMVAAGLLALTFATGIGGGNASAAENQPAGAYTATCVIIPAGQTAPTDPNAPQTGGSAASGQDTLIVCNGNDMTTSFASADGSGNCAIVAQGALPDGSLQGSAQGGTQQSQATTQSGAQQSPVTAPDQGATTQGQPAQTVPGTAGIGEGAICVVAGETAQRPSAGAPVAAGTVCTIIVADGAAAPQSGAMVTGQVVDCAAPNTQAVPAPGTAPTQPTAVPQR